MQLRDQLAPSWSSAPGLHPVPPYSAHSRFKQTLPTHTPLIKGGREGGKGRGEGKRGREEGKGRGEGGKGMGGGEGRGEEAGWSEGHSRTRGPKGPGNTPWDTPSDTSGSQEHSRDTSGPKGPKDSCSRPGGSQEWIRAKLYTPPPPPPISGQKVFSRGGGWGCIF